MSDLGRHERKTAGLGIGRDAQAPTVERAQAVFDAFRDIMGSAADHPELSHRLAGADVVLNVHLRDSPQELTLALHLDRTPIAVSQGAEPQAEVDLWIDTNDVLRFWTGDVHLAMLVLNREVETRGPIRKVLRVVPIARRLVAEFQRSAHDQGLVDAGTRAPTTTREGEVA